MWQLASMMPHNQSPNENNHDDVAWVKCVLEAAKKGSADAMNEMGNICNRTNRYSEAMYWYALSNSNDFPDGKKSMEWIAQKWKQSGAPKEYKKGFDDFFNEDCHKCSVAYLEMNANMKVSVPMDEIIGLVLKGVPIAAYLAGDIFEGQENYEMAYKMYNAISFTNDPHGLRCYADMLACGKGVEQDLQSAIHYYEMAAEKGERTAMYIMGQYCRSFDKEIAAYWYGVSHTRGFELSLDSLMSL